MPYNEQYESSLIRGIEEPRTWDLTTEIAKHAKPTDLLLDVGCGTAFKILKLSPYVREIYGLDPNPIMRGKAQENIEKANVTNMKLFEGSSERLPFPDETFDIVTCMVATQNVQEFHRVLRRGGWVISEQLGDLDKRAVADCFGDDEHGPRGIFGELGKVAEIDQHKALFKSLFSEVEIQVGQWNSYLTYEGLALLLDLVPLVRGFDRVRDEAGLKKAKDTLTTPKGIHVFHERLLIKARK